MRNEIRISGFGGQGVILSGIILTHALGMYGKKEVAQTQSYGPESRGGACKTEIVFSDKKIDYMKVDNPDYFLAFNDLSFKKYKDNLSENSYVLIDRTFIKNADANKFRELHGIHATKLAEEKLKGIVANIIMLGALAKTANIVLYESLEKAIKDIVDDRFYQININALELGYKEVE